MDDDDGVKVRLEMFVSHAVKFRGKLNYVIDIVAGNNSQDKDGIATV